MTIKATLIDKRGLHYLQNPNQKRKKKNSNVKEIPPTFDMFYLKFKKYFVNRFYHNAHKNEDSKAHLQLHKTYSFVKSISFPKTDLLDLVFPPFTRLLGSSMLPQLEGFLPSHGMFPLLSLPPSP